MSKIQKLVSENPQLYFLPLRKDKRPAVESWQWENRIDYDFGNCYGVGLICGAQSGGVEVIDIDLKYDHTETLYKRFKDAIHKADGTILEKLCVQATPSGGYHFIYRCEIRTKNTKLARRPVTDAEKAKNPDEKVKVLLETRGDGGYIACYPTPGYSLTYGSLQNIKTITPEQRQTIFDVARTFNEYFVEYKPAQRVQLKKEKGLTPIEDFNKRGEVVPLLEKHGWTVVGRKGSKVLLRRPGDTKATHSGNYDEANNWFSVFSTSTEFEPESSYYPSAVFAVLECKGDFQKATYELAKQGYGDSLERIREINEKVPSKVDMFDDNLDFLASPDEFLPYLENWRNNTFVKGQSTGIPGLDDYFLFKKGSLVIINGHDNVGKSVVIWYLFLLGAMYHGFKYVVYSSENSTGSFYKKMIEFYWNEQIDKMNAMKYQKALAFVKAHFHVIVSDNELYNYQDILNMTEKVIKLEAAKGNDIFGLLIDPYNSLKIDLNPKGGMSEHTYHYEAISKIKLTGKLRNLSIYVNCHAVTNALRDKDSDGYPKAPQKADTEGGGKWGNKADDFLTIHRKTQHPEEWMITEIHVRKIKETETGGRVTPLFEPVRLKAVKHLTGFEDMMGCNAVLRWHDQQSTKVPELKVAVNDNPAQGIKPSENFGMPYSEQQHFFNGYTPTEDPEEPPF